MSSLWRQVRLKEPWDREGSRPEDRSWAAILKMARVTHSAWFDLRASLLDMDCLFLCLIRSPWNSIQNCRMWRSLTSRRNTFKSTSSLRLRGPKGYEFAADITGLFLDCQCRFISIYGQFESIRYATPHDLERPRRSTPRQSKAAIYGRFVDRKNRHTPTRSGMPN